ncbi:PREDICTED: uncharacterized protein LOC104807342 [Tarenaya hassleriana]|uniref:uncharacterized protein LOC104807342 n=1 Tax=Tarenaya hassleriana TaxID=28532 RepID=UPI0008FD7F04|nr:PREDICTED: uncharacterized protein LOC104807342 [Tarenaya hassleriana]
MQGFHHQQQQLVALLSAALPNDGSAPPPPSVSTPPPPPSTSVSASVSTKNASSFPVLATGERDGKSENGESGRLSALHSLLRAITYPPNSLLVAHSASFLSSGLWQLLSDKSYDVRQAAATAYGALCAVVCSLPIESSGRQNHVMLGSLVDGFINWALPLFRHIGVRNGDTELAVEAVREFVTIGDVNGTDRYAFPILEACKDLLEDERTSVGLLNRILGVLSVISSKFSSIFHPHFLDVVDMLLGWALLPDLAESDRQIIVDSFLDFQKLWLNHLEFSLGLLSKFLGDMDVLLRDGGQGTPQQFRRLLALLSCFLAILRSTASGLLENNLLEKIGEPLCEMVPRLLSCLSMVGQRFGWSRWIEDLWKCLTLLAEILREKFSTFYPMSFDILFQRMGQCDTVNSAVHMKMTSVQIHGTLKINLQLLSLQKLGLLPSCVLKLLHFDSPISQLRLHPNHSVTASSTATYIFLLQHENEEIVQQAVELFMEELELLRGILSESMDHRNEATNVSAGRCYSKNELVALLKFDMKVLLACVSLKGKTSLTGQPELAVMYLKRSEKLVSFVVEKLNPFDSAIDANLELQVCVVRMLEWLAAVEFFSHCSVLNQTDGKPHRDANRGKTSFVNLFGHGFSIMVIEHMRKYGPVMVKALSFSSPLAVKLVSLEWVQQFCENLIDMSGHLNMDAYFCETFPYADTVRDMILAILDAAFDREPKVRDCSAIVLELLLEVKLIHPIHFHSVAETLLEKLGDPDICIRSAFIRLLSRFLPATQYACGMCDGVGHMALRPRMLMLGNSCNLHWKQVFTLKQLDQHFHSQQLVSVLNYVSQRWKVPFPSWIQWLIHAFRASKDIGVGHLEGNLTTTNGWIEINVDRSSIERISLTNNLAGAWWAVQEAAKFCVATRLRTNFGGPAQTFAALERMLLDITHVLQVESKQTDGSINIVGSSGAHLLPMRLLLDFVEALKKNVYNAYEGSAVLPSATPQSVLFFRANRKVCEEWFSRISEPMMIAGISLQSHDATIEYCILRLEELKGMTMSVTKEKAKMRAYDNIHNVGARVPLDISRILRHMSLALCKNHDAKALLGLQKWVSLQFAPLLVEGSDTQKDGGKWGLFPWITGLIYQSEGQYEKAAAYFAHLLQEEDSLSSMGSDDIQFVIERIIESYTALSDWKSLESWLLELQALRARHAGKSFSGSLTAAGNEINAIQALARFDEGAIEAAWACLDLTPKTSTELSLDPKLALQRSEQMLLQAMLFQVKGDIENVPRTLQKARSMLDETLLALSFDGLSETAPYATLLHCIFAFEENNQLGDSGPKQKHMNLISSSCVRLLQSLINRVHRDCSPWLKVLRVYRTVSPTSWVTLKLCMDLLGFSRKQGNILLANRLKSYLNDHVSSCAEVGLREFLISNLQYQGALLMFSENKVQQAVMDLWSFVRPDITSSQPVSLDIGVAFLKAKACLKLATWLGQDYMRTDMENVVLKMSTDFSRTVMSSAESNRPSVYESLNSKPSIRAIIEEMIGTVTKSSTQLCSTMGKSWISYASWCFRQATESFGKTNGSILRSCTFSSMLSQELMPERFGLTEDESKSVESAIIQLFQKNDANYLTNTAEDGSFQMHAAEHAEAGEGMNVLLQQVIEIIETAASDPGAENCGRDSVSVTLASRLSDLLLCTNKAVKDTDIAPIVDRLIEVWWSLRKRRVSLFGHSAIGFTQYLLYSSTTLHNSEFTGVDCDPLKQKTGSYTLRATLYILHILLNYGVELKDTLEHTLSSVPLEPWQEVIPQLYARLSSHPEEVVRKQIECLLIMLAKLSPWSIVYPTLVDVNACDKKPSEELLHITACLTELYPRLIQDVQLMINELGNVTVLWEELWLSTLQDLHMDVIRRINLLKEEAARVAENETLSQSEKNKINAAKYSAMMAPIVVALDRRLASTSRNPETPHEIWFHEEYMDRLRSAISTFKTPPPSTVLSEVWRPFDSIAASLASYQRKSSISLKEVAPNLGRLSSIDIPMPGLEKQVPSRESDVHLSASHRGIVTISSFSDHMTIIPTKTRPKKLVMDGSDGKKYTYLLKGREDLRLDARIMQLLQAINSIFTSSLTTHGNAVGIRYYSVTPISGRAGLIQWVENVISIYSIFKSWQTRVRLAQISPSAADSVKASAPPPVPRPSDMFYGKIIPALKEKGIRRVISRRDWPHDVKCKVLLDLMREVPKQLLHRELWCSSEGFRAFSSKLKRYSGSVAAMSIVGHILGLGDRHLDNILMDFCSGDVVHIDYNICFDKGQRLKVPEIVPFRLTQTMEAALGLTGVEGTFRANCEAVLGVLRKNKDILLMLMEVFVWDPLVEWTRGDFHDEAAIGGEERKGMEVAVSLSLFSSRVQEIRVRLQEHHDLLLTTLPAVLMVLERFSEVLNQYEITSSLFIRADQERSKLLLHETSTKMIVAEAACNSEKTRAAYEIQAREFSQAKALVSEKAQETALWIEQHGRILSALRGNMISEIIVSPNLKSMSDALSLTSAVLVAGVPLTVVPEPTQAQCHEIDREISILVDELNNDLSSALTALQLYSSALKRILPLNYHTTSLVYNWAQVLQLSAHALSADVLSLARRQAAELFAKIQGDNFDSLRNSYVDLCLMVHKYTAEIKKMEEEYAELSNSVGSGAESKAKDRLLYGLVNNASSSDEPASSISDVPKGCNLRDSGEKTLKALADLHIFVSSKYDQVKQRVHDIFRGPVDRSDRNKLQSESGSISCEFEEQVETCVILADILDELKIYIGQEGSSVEEIINASTYHPEGNWASIFQRGLLSCKRLVAQMTEVVLPDVLKTSVFCNSEIMDAFGLISPIRGSIDTALEHLIEVKLERDSLVELEQNYFTKVGLITDRQLALEEAAIKGRDHLSWEEAEELASQEEACRAQLDQLHQTWSQREFRLSALIKKEAQIKNSLILAENQFQMLINAEENKKPNDLGYPGVLAELVKPFSELEHLDRTLSSIGSSADSPPDWIPTLGDIVSSGQSLSEHIWSFGSLLSSHSFFIWKVGIIDSFIDSCIRDATSSVDQTLGFEQLNLFMKKKLQTQLQQRIDYYLAERAAPAFLSWLDKENERLKPSSEETEDLILDQAKQEYSTLKQVHIMLDEYCNAHETARAAKSAAFLMKRQVKELREALCRASLEIVQMEWMHDATLTPSQHIGTIFQKFFDGDDSLYLTFLNLRRPKLLEVIRSAFPKITKSIERLQACEQNSVTAEGQLERAMGWACGGPSPGAAGNFSSKLSGIPPEFHDHLLRRRQLLWDASEKASNIAKVCMSVLEFEASRDGIFQGPSEGLEGNSARTSSDSWAWQHSYMNLITRLEITYHSFTRTEQEWKLAQSSMEAASSGLYSATNELSIASLKAKAASGDLQSTVFAMRDCACESSVALSAFSRISRSHTALTSETGAMLEEVLAITEDLHDVHSLGKEAASVHCSLIEDLSKANAILIPLDSTLSKDVALIAEAMNRESYNKDQLPPLLFSFITTKGAAKIRESYQNLKPLVSPVLFSVKGLYSMLIKLAQIASVHAGNVNKALEGLGESEEVKSQESIYSEPDLTGDDYKPENHGEENQLGSHYKNSEEVLVSSGISQEDRGWMSSPDSIYSSSPESGITLTQAICPNGFNSSTKLLEETPLDEEEVKGFRDSAPSSQSDFYHASDSVLSVSADVVVENNGDNLKRFSGNESIENTEFTSSACNVAAEGRVDVSRHLGESSSSEHKSGGQEATKGTTEVQSDEASPPAQTRSRVTRDKNAYAMSVVKCMEMKIDGRDIAENREISIPEQVDYLIKQATSLDNLCNMYEGWTPWI